MLPLWETCGLKDGPGLLGSRTRVKDRISCPDGFTLLEVLWATAIFAIGILAVASMQGNAIQGNSFGRELTEGTCLAEAQLEWMKSQPMGSAALAVAAINDPDDPSYDADEPPVAVYDPNNPINKDGTPGGIYTRSWTVMPGTTLTSRRIAVTLAWSTGLGNHTITLSSITRGNGE